ncbi:unnamed protein product [uncultured bacterium]|nr:unnamed protein product [uncultured bacterium]
MRDTMQATDPSRLTNVSRLASLLLLALIPGMTGCLVIEKRSWVLVIPPDSKEIRMYYVLEGLSVEKQKGPNGPYSDLEKAKKQITELKEPDSILYFTFLSVFGTRGDSPLNDKFRVALPEVFGTGGLLEFCRFEDLRFYQDEKRKRPLCADRRVMVTDREEFAKNLNKLISRLLADDLRGDADELRDQLARSKSSLDANRKDGDDSFGGGLGLGMGPLNKTTAALLEICTQFDNDSIKKLQTAAKDGFKWVRFERETIRLVLPATPDCAKRIARDIKTAERIKEMQELVTPSDIEASDEGVVIVLGKKGEPIRLTHTDSRPHDPECEKRLIDFAGAPKPALIDDKPASADKLIEQFIAESKKKAKP